MDPLFPPPKNLGIIKRIPVYEIHNENKYKLVFDQTTSKSNLKMVNEKLNSLILNMKQGTQSTLVHNNL